MYIGFYSYTKQFNKNKIFLDPNSPLGDNLVYSFVFLAEQLHNHGHAIATLDMDELSNFDAVIFLEFPGFGNTYFKKLIKSDKDLYLIAFESPIIKPDNLDIKNHRYFKKIFTWNDSLVDNKKYFKLNSAYKIPLTLNFDERKREKLCAMIAGNKFTQHTNELYSERIKAIRWFEKNQPEDFDLFGLGWDRYNFSGIVLGVNIARLNRLKFLTELLAPNYPSYKGSIRSKNEIYQQYKFSICYENVKDALGYITEKIFDCFFAGCVPIYWGADSVIDHIPANTFINKKDFDTYEKLYDYMKNMSDTEYLGYQEAIKNFLKSEKAYPFSAECFADTIIKNILS